MNIGLPLLSPGNYQLAHGLELGVACIRHPFEGHGFGGGQHRASLLEPAERHVVVHRAACGQGIDREENVEARGQEVESRLSDADVRFHPDQHDIGSAEHLQFFEESARATTAERGLRDWRVGQASGEIGCGGPKALWVLFSRADRDAQECGHVEDEARVTYQTCRRGDFDQ